MKKIYSLIIIFMVAQSPFLSTSLFGAEDAPVEAPDDAELVADESLEDGDSEEVVQPEDTAEDVAESSDEAVENLEEESADDPVQEKAPKKKASQKNAKEKGSVLALKPIEPVDTKKEIKEKDVEVKKEAEKKSDKKPEAAPQKLEPTKELPKASASAQENARALKEYNAKKVDQTVYKAKNLAIQTVDVTAQQRAANFAQLRSAAAAQKSAYLKAPTKAAIMKQIQTMQSTPLVTRVGKSAVSKTYRPAAMVTTAGQTKAPVAYSRSAQPQQAAVRTQNIVKPYAQPANISVAPTTVQIINKAAVSNVTSSSQVAQVAAPAAVAAVSSTPAAQAAQVQVVSAPAAPAAQKVAAVQTSTTPANQKLPTQVAAVVSAAAAPGVKLKDTEGWDALNKGQKKAARKQAKKKKDQQGATIDEAEDLAATSAQVPAPVQQTVAKASVAQAPVVTASPQQQVVTPSSVPVVASSTTVVAPVGQGATAQNQLPVTGAPQTASVTVSAQQPAAAVSSAPVTTVPTAAATTAPVTTTSSPVAAQQPAAAPTTVSTTTPAASSATGQVASSVEPKVKVVKRSVAVQKSAPVLQASQGGKNAAARGGGSKQAASQKSPKTK